MYSGGGLIMPWNTNTNQLTNPCVRLPCMLKHCDLGYKTGPNGCQWCICNQRPGTSVFQQTHDVTSTSGRRRYDCWDVCHTLFREIRNICFEKKLFTVDSCNLVKFTYKKVRSFQIRYPLFCEVFAVFSLSLSLSLCVSLSSLMRACRNHTTWICLIFHICGAWFALNMVLSEIEQEKLCPPLSHQCIEYLKKLNSQSTNLSFYRK